ncbi:MAG TPA: hypothetical protein HA362_04100 [Nanoarchaeota archaeon]|nr:hypothetical protein [Nanoarchaeota archaeon]
MKKGKQEALEDKTKDLHEACRRMEGLYAGRVAENGYLLVCTPVISKMKIQARIHQPNKWGEWPDADIMQAMLPDKFSDYPVRMAYSKAGLSAEDFRN